MAGWDDFLSGIGDFSAYQLEATPSLAYFSAAPFQDASAPAQRRYWEGQYGNVSNQYAGAVGSALRTGGQGPSFTQFLEDMPWTERYTSLSPSMRGESYRRYAPTTRYAYR